MPHPRPGPRRCSYTVVSFAAWLIAGLSCAAALLPREPRYREGRLLVQPKDAADTGALERFHRDRHSRVTRSFAASGGPQVVEFATDRSVADELDDYRRSGLVEWAEPDYLLHTCLAPTDPLFADGSQWHLENTGRAGGRPGADLEARAGWDLGVDASDVIVAVVDSGVRYTHEDLVANLWVNPGETAGNGIDDDHDGYVDDVHGINAAAGNGDPMDDIGHGTHVAGILGASANNGLGGAGVVWRVRILACKFLTEDGEGATSDAIECLDYARARGAKVVNCSWGGSANSVALRNAFRRLRDAGIAVAVAAGNDGLDIDAQPQYPASYAYENMVTVVATTSTDQLADFSNYGLVGTHIGAPGVSIASTWFSSDRAYTRQSGTSMATPMASGILALLRAEHPAETAAWAIQRLRDTAEPLASLAGVCATGGRANLFRASKGLPFLRLSVGSAGGWSLEITGSPASLCRIEASQDLAAWQTLGEVTLSENGIATFPGPVDHAQARFLRLVVLP